MTDRRRIEYRSDLDTREFEAGSRRMRDRFSDMGRGLQDLGIVGFGQLSQAMGFTARDAIQAARDAVGSVVNWTILGDNVKQVAGSYREVFGPAADFLMKKLGETRRSMGLSRTETEGMLIPIGLMATNAGFAADEARGLAGKLLTLAGDVSAFNPTVGTSAEALGAMQAALRGEFDPLERFGSKLSAARVKAEAARLRGSDPLNASLSDQQLQIMAVVSLLESDLAPALGTLKDREGTAADNALELESAFKDARDAGYRLSSEVLGPMVSLAADDATALADAAEQGNILRFAFGAIDTAGQFMGARLGGLTGVLDAFSGSDGGKSGTKSATDKLNDFYAAMSAVNDEIVTRTKPNLEELRTAQDGYRTSVENAYQPLRDSKKVMDQLWDNYQRMVGWKAPWENWPPPPYYSDSQYHPPEQQGKNNQAYQDGWIGINGGGVQQ